MQCVSIIGSIHGQVGGSLTCTLARRFAVRIVKKVIPAGGSGLPSSLAYLTDTTTKDSYQTLKNACTAESYVDDKHNCFKNCCSVPLLQVWLPSVSGVSPEVAAKISCHGTATVAQLSQAGESGRHRAQFFSHIPQVCPFRLRWLSHERRWSRTGF